MSGGSQHNPNGRQSQLGSGWSPLQLQVANLLARAPQAHMASERGVTWHTPTPPPHLYHVPAPSPPDPLQALSQLQAMKSAGNSVFRHTATPPEIYRHTPTPPEKHLLRHTPSPGDVKGGATLPPAELYPHLGPGRDKLRAEELLAYARGGVDLSLGGPRGANGSPAPPTLPAPPAPTAPPALSVRDAPTINSLIARAAPHARPAHARVDALLERLAAAPAPASPHSVIVHSRAAPTPSPPSSNEDSADSCGAPPGSKRKRKPERTIRVPAPVPPPPAVVVPSPPPRDPPPVENGDVAHPPPAPLPAPPHPAATATTAAEVPAPPPVAPVAPRVVNGPPRPPSPRSPPAPEPHVRRKTRSNSAETIDDIAAMIASREPVVEPPPAPALVPEPETVTVDKLKSVLASPDPTPKSPVEPPAEKSPVKAEPQPEPGPPPGAAAAPKRRSARTSNAESTNVPVESPSEAKPAEPEAAEARSAEPTAASFVEVENQLEKMFAGIEEGGAEGPEGQEGGAEKAAKPRNRRKSVPSKDTPKKPAKRARRALTMAIDEPPRNKSPPRRKNVKKKSAVEKTKKTKEPIKDAYDSGSNASSSKSRGPYIQIVGPRASPVSVSVVNAGEEERRGEEWRGRNGLRARGLHASTLGLRYDATTPDATWLCAFCDAGPHYQGRGDLFGPYSAEIDCDEYRALDEASRRRFEVRSGAAEVWLHEACGVWAPGLVAAGARLWGLAAAVWAARASRCALCNRPGASVACAARACRARVHLPCAERARWTLHDDYRALCSRHA